MVSRAAPTTFQFCERIKRIGSISGLARAGKDGLKRAKRAVKDAADAMTNVIGDAAKQALADVQGKAEKAQDKASTRH